MSSCALCSNNTKDARIVENGLSFCCAGCQAVYGILSAKNLLHQYQDTPVFQQALRYGIISNPALLEQIRNKGALDGEIEKVYFEIEEMWCPSCAEVITLVLSQEAGVKSCLVDYSTDLAAVEYSPKQISQEHLFELIRALGYSPQQHQIAETKKISRSLAIRLCIAAFCSLNIMMFSYPLYAMYFDYEADNYGSWFAWLSLVFSLPVLTYSAWPIFRRFLSSFRLGIFGMETLVVIGVLTSFFLSFYELMQGGTRVYFDSMTVIIVFVLLGKVIESKAKFSAKESLFRLNRSLPKRGRKRLADNTTVFVSIKEIAFGDVVIACSGEKIVLDGVIIEGEGTCDESIMTGESLPVAKTVGLIVLSGTILQNGWIAYRVTTTSEQSALQRIVDLIGKDISLKAHYGNYVDHIVRWFVPTVLLISVCAMLYSYISGHSWETTIIRGISVLLISCPCAIGIAAPLVESQLLHCLAGLGAIVRNRGCLRLLGKETVFVFDKTGTITEGKFTVLNGLVEKSILGSLARQSSHPMSIAIAHACESTPVTFTNIEEHAGRGIRGIFEGDHYALGSAEFVKIRPELIHNDQILSCVYFTKNGEHVTTIQLADCLRVDAQSTVAALKPVKTWLLSGDSLSPVQKIAHLCEFDYFRAQCSPLEKREEIETLRVQNEIICMLGDGINDAPALTSAHIGISMINAADISIQVSDILLTTDKLGILPKIRVLALKGRRIMHQNLFWAFAYNVVGMGLAFFGALSPIFAAFAMVASSLMVLANAKRLSPIKDHFSTST